jgi:hypothetical protein
VHGQHHGAVIIRLEHGLAGLGGAHALFTTQRMETMREIFQVLAGNRIDDADAFKRDFQSRGHLIDFSRVTQEDGRAEAQRPELPGGLQDAGFLTFRKNDPLGMPLQFFDDLADESHARSFGFRREGFKRRYLGDPD